MPGRSPCKDEPVAWETTVLRTVDEVESIRPVWEMLQAEEPHRTVNTDIDRYLSVLRTLADDVTPLVLLLEESGQPRAMMVGRLEKHAIHLRLGYTTLLKPRLRCMTVVYGGVLGQPDTDVSAVLIRTLMDLMRRGLFDVAFFNHLRVESDFYRQVSMVPRSFCRGPIPRIEPHWRMVMPKTIETFYAARSKKHRSHLRQYRRKLERRVGQSMRMQTYCRPEEVPQAAADAAAISANTYQAALGVGFRDSPARRLLLQTAAEKGWFRGHILYLNDAPAAFRFALKYGRVYHGDGIGYDPQWRELRIGTTLFLMVLEQLCQERAVDYYDFGFGDAGYKESYADEYWMEADATYVFAPRAYPLLINMLATTNAMLLQAAQWLSEKLGLTAWLKRRWRRGLQSRSASKSD